MLPAQIGGAMNTPGAGFDVAGLMVALKVLVAFAAAFVAMGLAAVLALVLLETRRPARAAEGTAMGPAPHKLALPVVTAQFGRFQG
jgi:hypothetical protein